MGICVPTQRLLRNCYRWQSKAVRTRAFFVLSFVTQESIYVEKCIAGWWKGIGVNVAENKKEMRFVTAFRWPFLFCQPRKSNISIPQQPLVGQALLSIEASRSHSDTRHSVGLLWTGDQPDAEISTWQCTAPTRQKHLCPLWKLKPQPQQASGRRSTPLTARPLGSAHTLMSSLSSTHPLRLYIIIYSYTFKAISGTVRHVHDNSHASIWIKEHVSWIFL